jgi:sensor histidine kinase YesM
LVVVQLTTTDLAFGYVFVDSVVFCFILACFIILIWYPVRFNRWERRTWHFNLAAHVTLAGMILVCWLLVGYCLCFLMGLWNDTYFQFLNISLSWKAPEGMLFYAVAVLVYYLYVYTEQLNEKAANEIRLHKLLRDGELNLLKSQINPHFLFNSMNSVNSLITSKPEQAQKMLVALSDYMRYAVLATKRENSCVADEMENIARYLSIEQLRFGDKLQYDPDIDPSALSVEIPSMLLQPLFENAIKHGVYESLEAVRIVTKITKDRHYLNIAISNDFDEEGVSQKKGSGTGLQNIRERLRLLYGTSAAMQAKAENGVFKVILKIPLSN